MDIQKNTPLSFLTWGDLQNLIESVVSDVMASVTDDIVNKLSEEPKRYAHSIADIAEAWGCSKRTASRMKNNELAPYISQEEGRHLFTLDIDFAMKEMARRGIKRR